MGEAMRTNKAGANKTPSANAAEQLRIGTQLLVEAMSKLNADVRTGDKAPYVGEFREAYASIVRSLPKQTRLTVLGAMREGIDAVVRAESKASSVRQEANRGVGTADFMAGLKRQEEAEQQRDIASGELLPGSEMQRRLQISAQALSAAMKRKRIFAIKGAGGRYHYPAFFADSAYDRATLERVAQALGDLPGTSKLHFFTSPRQSLEGLNPLQALAKGRVDAVLDQANAFLET